MDRLLRRVGVIALFAVLGAVITFAGEPKPEKSPEAPKSGFRAELLGQVSFVEKRIEDLADAIPAAKYTWRPGEGVRSVSEVYLHIIGSNYFFGTFLGAKSPVKTDSDYDKSTTDKAEIAKQFKPSFDYFRNLVLGLSDKDLDKTTNMFGMTTTYRNVLVTAVAHMHEHLGQSIAYARVGGVVPPWTAADQAAAKKDMK